MNLHVEKEMIDTTFSSRSLCSDAVSESQSSYLYQIPEPEAASTRLK